MTSDNDDNDSKADDDEETKARKRKERLEQNRISARESRKRKKTMIEELQRTVITLSRENKDLNERNESLRRQLMELGAKYPNIVPLQAIVGQGTAPQQQQEGGGLPSMAGAGLPVGFNPLSWGAPSNNNNQADVGAGDSTNV
ncbi:hypothetical protein MPSEU_001052100 [Mayamaea pseudoterrestris]|nr:hypothetical protein MPSEU_001052100 [Mayamaea pseudoterrestris]